MAEPLKMLWYFFDEKKYFSIYEYAIKSGAQIYIKIPLTPNSGCKLLKNTSLFIFDKKLAFYN